MALLGRNSAFSRVTALAEQRSLHQAFRWLHLNGQRMMRWQEALVAIPAPPFGEQQRSEWVAQRFEAAGLKRITTDGVGNVFAHLPTMLDNEAESQPATLPVILLSAHLDTVFPAGTLLKPIVTEERIESPGACDNAAGVIGMLAIAHALIEGFSTDPSPASAEVVFCGNVGEEGEGDLRGVREIYANSPYAHRIVAHIVLDGAGAETAVTQALGSRRFRITVTGPGGHSFTDAGIPNPILALANSLTNLAATPLIGKAQGPRTTLNIGTIEGGTSVNTIPDRASATVDFRSTDSDQLLALEVALHRAVEDAVEAANLAGLQNWRGREAKSPVRGILYQIEKIGDRPAAELPGSAPLLDALRAVDRHLNLRTDLRLGSTDANIPLSLGIQAVSLGAGGDGGGAHTRKEWYSAQNRELGLRRILLLTLAMIDWAGNHD